MKSAQENLERSQRRLAALLGKTNPLFPKAYAKDLADAQNDVVYWTRQAAVEANAAVNLFAPAPVQQAQPQIVYYKPPTIPDSTSTTTNTVMAVGAIVAIVAVVAFLRVR